MRKVIALFILVKLFLLNSCYSEEELPPPTNVEFLTSGEWVYERFTVTPPLNINGSPVSDILSAVENCSADNSFQYSKDGTFKITEGKTKCSNTDPEIISSGTWRFSEDGKDLIEVFEDGSVLISKVSEINGSNIFLSWEEPGSNGQVFNFFAKYARYNRFK